MPLSAVVQNYSGAQIDVEISTMLVPLGEGFSWIITGVLVGS